MSAIKRVFKKNSRNPLFKMLAGLGRSMNRLYENRNHDIQSNGEITVLKKIARINPSLIIDGGANVGDYSVAISQYIPGCKVFAFEPVIDTFNLLKQNTKACSNVLAVNKGLFKETCKKKINIFPSNEHSSLYDIQGINYQPIKTFDVEFISGDDFVKENAISNIDFLKIDVEGAEYDALLGFENSIKKGLIKAVQFEYGYINITTKKLLIDFYQFFEAHNYIVGKVLPNTVEFRKYEFKHEDFIGPNFIAVHKSETDLIELLRKR